jgi:hypothetical protein
MPNAGGAPPMEPSSMPIATGDPQTLQETGLYSDAATETLADDVMEYEPAYELWSAGSAKRRFVRIPPGEVIDTSDMNAWRFPVGTRLWKEFVRDGVRVETRFLEKRQDGLGILGWFAIAYAWNEAQTEAKLSREGVIDALGTKHDIPGRLACRECHGGANDGALGFSAIQLSGQKAGLSLQGLADRQLLSSPPQGMFVPPGDATAQRALGQLHANCGHCHNPLGAAFERSDMELWLDVDSLTSVESTLAYRTAVGVPLGEHLDSVTLRIQPGVPALSGVIVRMSSREELVAMPPLASELIDEAGVSELSAWISAMGSTP